MCIFSGSVERVADTRIFARRAENGRQVLVYQMRYAARRPVAMILPIPVSRQTGSGPLVQFVSLKHYADFFEDMNRAFPVPPSSMPPGAVSASAPQRAGVLRVENIGDFVASFVPTIADFRRLDKRFVLPEKTWAKIPAYADYGFAVFQLKAAPNAGQSVHPMAFSFASRSAHSLFFPTVHIHDEQVHPYEKFDHQLFYQMEPTRRLLGLLPVRTAAVPKNAEDVSFSSVAFGNVMNVARTKGLVGAKQKGIKARLYGSLPNTDTWVRDGA